MGLQLPGELVSLLGMLGYTWPLADEERLLAMGQSWLAFADTLAAPVAEAESQANSVWTNASGAGITAFQQAWTDAEAPNRNLADGGTAATLVGVGLFVCAGIVLALKINVIVQLVLLAIQIAQAVATAVVTFGASLLQIPIFKTITGLVIDMLLGLAVDAVLMG